MKKHAPPVKPSEIKYVLKSFRDEEITRILENSPNFRQMKMARRDKFYTAMMNGWWEWANGEPLGFDTQNRLINGQHRLAAAQRFQADTGHIAWFWCATNLQRAVERSMDQGDNRLLADYLRAEHIKNASTVCTIVHGHVRFRNLPEASRQTLAGLSGTISEGGKGVWVRPSVAELIDFYKRNRGKVDEWAAIGVKLRNAHVLRAGMMASLGYALADVDDTNAKLFFSYLEDGAGLKSGDPILLLRERLSAARTKRERLPPTVHCALTVKAWVAWNTGAPIQRLKWSGVGPYAESFPDHRITVTA